MLKIVKMEPKYTNQLNEMMDEWTKANENLFVNQTIIKSTNR